MINFKKKKMNLLTEKQQESYEKLKICYICKEKSENKYLEEKVIVKLVIIIIIQESVEVLRITYVI